MHRELTCMLINSLMTSVRVLARMQVAILRALRREQQVEQFRRAYKMLPIYLLLGFYWIYTRFIRNARRRWQEMQLKRLRKRVIVMCPYPEPGHTLPHLTHTLGAEGAALVQLHMVYRVGNLSLTR